MKKHCSDIKLNTHVTPDMIQDFLNYKSFDAEYELYLLHSQSVLKRKQRKEKIKRIFKDE